MRNGVFDGVIQSERDGTFYCERANKYFPRHNATHSGFHSVIYHDNHVEDPYAHLREGHSRYIFILSLPLASHSGSNSIIRIPTIWKESLGILQNIVCC